MFILLKDLTQRRSLTIIYLFIAAIFDWNCVKSIDQIWRELMSLLCGVFQPMTTTGLSIYLHDLQFTHQQFLVFFFKTFVLFWLHWVFVVALGLRSCGAWA